MLLPVVISSWLPGKFSFLDATEDLSGRASITLSLDLSSVIFSLGAQIPSIRVVPSVDRRFRGGISGFAGRRNRRKRGKSLLQPPEVGHISVERNADRRQRQQKPLRVSNIINARANFESIFSCLYSLGG